MIKHLSDEQLNGYIHQTLSDDQHEAMDRHLAECPDCRTHLTSHETTQRRIHQSLMIDLKSARPSPQMTYAAIARLKHTPETAVWRRARRAASGAVALTALIMLIVVLAELFSNSSQQTIGGITSPGESVGRGWFSSGNSQTNEYDLGIDHTVAYTGQSSGYIKSTAANPTGWVSLMQIFRADEYRGTLLRLSAYIKADRVDGRAGLWMRIAGPGDTTLAYDDMHSRPIKGTSDWTRFETVLDVPENSVNISFGLFLTEGSGEVWIDDVQFDVIGKSIATAMPMVTPTPTPTPATPVPQEAIEQPLNLDFEASLKGWQSEAAYKGYETGTDRAIVHSGQASGFIQSLSPGPRDDGALMQSLKADAYHGQRVRVSGYVKSTGVAYRASFWARVIGPDDQTLRSDSWPLGETEWRPLAMVLDVPEESARIEYGITLQQKGRVWIDDVQIEVVGLDVPTTGVVSHFDGSRQPQDLGFEAGVPADQLALYTGTFTDGMPWMAGSTNPDDYVIDIDDTVAHTGKASGHIKSQDSANGLGFASLVQNIVENSYLGKRVRLSGYVKTDQVKGSAGLWMRVDGPNQVMSIDNMHDRSILGTTDWQQYYIVLDVPSDSTGIAFGALLEGTGEVWIDDLQLEVVGTDVPTTNSLAVKQEQPLNLDLED